MGAFVYMLNTLFPEPGGQGRTVSEEELHCATNAINQYQALIMNDSPGLSDSVLEFFFFFLVEKQ